MAKIDDEGLEKLQHIHNAIDVIYDKLDVANVFDTVAEEFEYIVEILEEAKNDCEKV